MLTRGIVILLAVVAIHSAAAQPTLVADLNPAVGGSFNSAPAGPFAALGGRMLFFTRFGLHTSDGTPAGTSLLVPGCARATPTSNGTVGMSTATLGPRVIFNGPGGALWSTDGSVPGTSPLLSSTGSSVIFRGSGFAGSGATAYFLGALNTTDAPALWQTDGTPAGTIGGAAFPPAGYTLSGTIAAGGGFAYAVARNTNTLDYVLLRADTTGAPPTQVALLAGAAFGSLPHAPDLIATDNSLYFTGSSTDHPDFSYVWRIPFSTGQILPTGVTLTIPFGGQYNLFLGTVGNTAMLAQNNNTGGGQYQLWSVSPTAATRLANSFNAQYPVFYDTAVGGSFFSAWQLELCRTDGTPAGTVHAPLTTYPAQLTRVGNECWFSNTGTGGLNGKWYAWDTVSAAPRELVTLPGTNSNGLLNGGLTAALDGKLFFNFANSTAGAELWVTDGTPTGTLQLQDLGHSTLDSTLGWFISWNNLAFFTTSSSSLWVTDGTAAGTHAVLTSTGATVAVSRLASTPNCLLVDTGAQLIRSDGTSAGTFAIGPHPTSGIASGYPERHAFVAATPSGITYFGASDTTDGTQLWRTDGSVAGTYKVTTRAAGFLFGTLAEFGPIGPSSAVFNGASGVNSRLWRTDGTPAGTVPLPATVSPYMERPAKFGNLCVFANNGFWRTDGTLSGTILLTAPGLIGTYTGAAAGPRFFFADTSTPPIARATDGTVGGTVVIPGVNPTAVGHVGSIGLFNSAAGVFASNGSAAPALLLSSTPAVLRDHTFFDAPDATYYFGTDGYIWKTGGTPATTVRADPLVAVDGGSLTLNSQGAPNNDTSSEFDAALAGPRLVFTASSPIYGRELWAIAPRPISDCNTNARSDLYDIADNLAFDANHDNVIDSCECLADWSGHGIAVQDILDFVDDWFVLAADFNHSGATTIEDIFDFLNAWLAGCP
jgi:ELWxxDGT repeat protein